jgi:hypothetical protein
VTQFPCYVYMLFQAVPSTPAGETLSFNSTQANLAEVKEPDTQKATVLFTKEQLPGRDIPKQFLNGERVVEEKKSSEKLGRAVLVVPHNSVCSVTTKSYAIKLDFRLKN